MGIPKGLNSYELGLGIQTRLISPGLYFFGCKTINLNMEIASNLSLGLFHRTLSIPGVLRPLFEQVLRIA